ncbi:hypothetical protein PTTG_08205 [Puccinia triticina 1-1 BBBD Race 1]|uniref:Uncharacterized protein n=1 Tax=Puccinia triticina (isolate 1-1 / race 1 (BBBD)) TaxID=630390 RepID=A0A180G6Z4_PUCT1|nr:hypothetical protein PTTG_08205 [Puccinia triticina 1-1 BBBD Race 1]
MASYMYDLLTNGNGTTTAGDVDWDPTTMHIQCICHKLALIVNAGLAALSLKTLPPGKAKELVLGFFPVLGRLTEEEEPKEPEFSGPLPVNEGKVVDRSNSGQYALDVDSNADYGNADNEASDTGEELAAATDSY